MNALPSDKNHIIMASFYSSTDASAAKHTAAAAALKAGILDLFWDSSKVCHFVQSHLEDTRLPD